MDNQKIQVEEINTENKTIKKQNRSCGKYTVLKILGVVLCLVLLVYLISGFVDVVNTPKDENQGIKLGFYFAISVVIIGTIGAFACIIPSLIGLILTLVKRARGQKIGQVIYFAVMTALPVIIVFIFILLCKAM